MTGHKLLELAHLRVTAGVKHLVHDVSLEVHAGQILALVGASGSGKSMTALGIMRLLPPGISCAGAVLLNGEPLGAKSEAQMQAIRGREIGMVFQEPMSALNPLMRIGDQVAETVRLHRRVAKSEARHAAREALASVGLPGERNAIERLPYELSGGQRQRVAVALATVMSPSLLIADEPTTALDVITQAQVLALLQKLVRVRNMGLILVTHDLAVAAQLADEIAVMHRGEIVEQGAAAQILRRPGNSYTAALLAAAQLQPRRAAPRQEAGAPLLLVSGVVHEYPRRRTSLWRPAARLRAVDEVSLSVYPGETVGLVGESGSGKSTLLRVILALERAQAGQVSLLGERFAGAHGGGLTRLRRAIQAVFQDPYGSFDPKWTVEQLIAEPFFLLNAPPTGAERRRKVAGVLEQVGLSAADARRLPREFSGGERQRIAIARALVTGPAVIAFDEAVSALDVLIRAQILQLLAELAERHKVSYLFVSHDLQVIRAIADRIYVMQRGRVVEEGPTETVFTAPRHAYTQALIAANPRMPVA
ncbi:MAG TPA: ABC transporter ATP-binding protein [Steroidobacteraceae bacterium]|nr:ABC transporter ATP-binding protein [Steroidobacteraceae bacterium]